MRRPKYKHILLAGSFILLVVVSLLSFGERARQGRYHLDGSRGWDLPTTVDSGHAQVLCTAQPSAIVSFDQIESRIHALVVPLEPPAPRLFTIRGWFRLRPPPQA